MSIQTFILDNPDIRTGQPIRRIRILDRKLNDMSGLNIYGGIIYRNIRTRKYTHIQFCTFTCKLGINNQLIPTAILKYNVEQVRGSRMI